MKIRILPSLLLATACLVGCQNSENNNVAPAIPSFTVATAIQDSVTLYASYPGYLEAKSTVNLVARVAGYQLASNYTAGQNVAKGDTLFIIEPTQYEDAVAQAEANLATSKAELYYAENNYNRMKDVVNTNAISEIDYIKAEASYYKAQAAVINAEAALKTARTQLSYCYITAPFSGRPNTSEYGDGDYVNASSYMATIYQDYQLSAYFSIDDAQYMKLVQNLKNNNTSLARDAVKLSFAEKLPHEYTGRIDYIAPNIDLSTGTIKVRLVVDNPYGELKHGMYTTIHMPYSRSEEVLMVHDASIATDQVGKYLYIVNDSNYVEMRHVEIGELYNDSLRIIDSGISAGERYVSLALQKVHEGMKINPVE